MTETRRSDLVAAMQRICTAIVAAAAVTLLAACTAGPGGKKASDDDTDETPEVTKPKPSLLGTWRGTDDWYKHDDRTDDYYVAGTEMITLTFTKERYIEVRSAISFDGMESGDGHQSGTWETTDSTVTRTRNEDHDDATPGIDMSVTKAYYLLGEAGDVLYMHNFADANPTTEFKRYERVENPLPRSSLAGVWVWTITDEDGDTTRTRRITINTDGTLQLVDAATGGTQFEAVIDAKWTLDEDNYYLNLTDPTSSDGQSVMADRIAFAPTAKSPNEIVVSFYWHETEDSDDYYKYGNYYMFCERQ